MSDVLPRGRLTARQVLVQKVKRNVESVRFISVHTADEPVLIGAAGQDGILADSAVEILGELFPSNEDLAKSGLERPLRDMGIARIGRNVAKMRKLKLGKRLMDGGGGL